MGRPALLYPNAPYLVTATASATDSFSGTSASAVLSAREDTYWRPLNASGAKVLTLDLTAARIIDTLALVGEALDGVVLTVETSPDNSAWTTRASGVNLFAPVNCAWLTFAASSSRYLRLTVSAFGSAFRLAWVCACDIAEAPYLEKDFDPESISDAGEALTSPGGLYLGNVQQRAMRELTLAFGGVLDGEMLILRQWAEQCLRTGRPFVFVPDLSGAGCYFCWMEKPKFSAPRNVAGMYELEPVSVLTRAD